jgi:hypothetical protein
MAATVLDVANSFRARLEEFVRVYEGVVDAAFIEETPNRYQLRLTTLIGRDDNQAENQLARLELDLEQTFKEWSMSFSTIHLRERKAEEFIPTGAFPVIPLGAARPSR